MNRRLYRCRDNRMLAGVAAGVAEFFDLDPTLVRVLWFVSIFFGGLSILVYIGLAIIVPLEPITDEAEAAESGATPEGHRHSRRGSGRLTTFIGFVLILLGSLALIDALLPASSNAWHFLWPVFLLAIGAFLLVGALRRDPTNE